MYNKAHFHILEDIYLLKKKKKKIVCDLQYPLKLISKTARSTFHIDLNVQAKHWYETKNSHFKIPDACWK